jgi:hypothetical protein
VDKSNFLVGVPLGWLDEVSRSRTVHSKRRKRQLEILGEKIILDKCQILQERKNWHIL